ncbi:MAG: SpoIIE family protein phosphatase, partial [Holophagales bacterium]|nr:SpoIIE family protein phosphatase [Holophagales bacterium]
EALAAAFAEPPDLVLLDIMMPKQDGFEVCAELLADERTKTIPIIFLTALDDKAKMVEGLLMGAADYITKPFNREEVLARVKTQLRLRSLTKTLAEQNQRLLDKQRIVDSDLAAAAELQRTLIPSEGIQVPGVELAWRFQPCDSIGGDIFNVLQLGDGVLGFYLVDVTGHGVPSAMVTVSVAQSLAAYTAGSANGSGTGEIPTPVEVLHNLDDDYPPDRFGKTFTISYALLDTKTGKLVYSSAAHPPPVLLRRDGGVELLEEGGPLIGLGAFLPYEQGETTVEAGDRLILYSDGILEHAPEDQPTCLFGSERFLEALSAVRHRTLDRSCQAVFHQLDLHAPGSPPLDDITLLAIEFGPMAGAVDNGPANGGPGGNA